MGYIEIEKGTGFVLRVVKAAGKGLIELTPEQHAILNKSKYGHAEFMYLNGELIQHPDLHSELAQSSKKAKDLPANIALFEEFLEFMASRATP